MLEGSDERPAAVPSATRSHRLDTPLVQRLLDRWPAQWQLRAAPSWPAVAALSLVGVVAALVAALLLVRDRPHAVAAPVRGLPPAALPAVTSATTLAGPPSTAPVGTSAPPASSASPAPTPSPATVVVDVVGPVRHPGVVRLAAGSRVVDALAAAGGLRSGADPGLLNLAAVVADGQQVVVGGAGAGVTGGETATSAAGAPPAASIGGGASAAGSGPLDLNTATLEQLDGLPGIGPVLAQRILDWRAAHGRFVSVDQLGEVGGIGERRLAELRPKVRV